jgi:hypothetical protein
MVTVTINDSTTPVVFDDLSGTGTFSANPGDVCVLTDVDSNPTGSSLPSAPFTITAPAPANVPGVPHHIVPTGPLLGEQFGPLTVTTPGVPR